MDMQALQRGSAMNDGMQRFTATGRPYKAEPLSGWANDAYGGPPTHSTPMKFTDDDIISVPIRRTTLSPSQSDSARKKSIFKKLFSSSNNGDIIVKQMTRGEYLKHYAKDEEGTYIGTEEPADDCVLKEGDRRAKHGEGVMVGKWSNEILVMEEKKERRGWKGRDSGTVIRACPGSFIRTHVQQQTRRPRYAIPLPNSKPRILHRPNTPLTTIKRSPAPPSLSILVPLDLQDALENRTPDPQTPTRHLRQILALRRLLAGKPALCGPSNCIQSHILEHNRPPGIPHALPNPHIPQPLLRLLLSRTRNLLAWHIPRPTVRARPPPTTLAPPPFHAPPQYLRSLCALCHWKYPRAIIDVGARVNGYVSGRLLRDIDGCASDGVPVQRYGGADVLGKLLQFLGIGVAVWEACRSVIDRGGVANVHSCVEVGGSVYSGDIQKAGEGARVGKAGREEE